MSPCRPDTRCRQKSATFTCRADMSPTNQALCHEVHNIILCILNFFQIATSLLSLRETETSTTKNVCLSLPVVLITFRSLSHQSTHLSHNILITSSKAAAPAPPARRGERARAGRLVDDVSKICRLPPPATRHNMPHPFNLFQLSISISMKI